MYKNRFKSALLIAIAAGGFFMGAASASADEWGAISIDLVKADRSPYYGIGGGNSEDEATKNAQKFCGEAGGRECKVVVTYNQCGAYAASKTGGGWGKSATRKTAEAQAMSGCNADSCKVVVSDCN